MTKPNFSTMGTFGDTIYSLCLMKILGGGNLYVKLNALDDFARTRLGWQDAGPAAGRYTKEDYNIIEPLLQAQDYLDKVTIWRGEPLDYQTLDNHFTFHMTKGWQGNQTECYALTQGMDITDPIISKKLLHEPWLTPVEPIKVPGKPFVVARSPRYLYGEPSKEWYKWAKNGLGDQAIFIGSEEEHEDFEKAFNIKIEHYATSNLLEVAQLIQGSEQFMGNQSVALSIAIGLGKTYWCEIRKDFQSTKTAHGYGDTWFPRINGSYF